MKQKTIKKLFVFDRILCKKKKKKKNLYKFKNVKMNAQRRRFPNVSAQNTRIRRIFFIMFETILRRHFFNVLWVGGKFLADT